MMNLLIWISLGTVICYYYQKTNTSLVPKSVIVIFIGLIIGPSVLGILEIAYLESLIVNLIVVFVLFSAGYEIEWNKFSSSVRPGMLVAISGIVLCLVFGFLASYLMTKNFDESVYIAIALSATSIGLAIPLIKQQGLLSSKVGQILLAATVLDDFIALYLLALGHLFLSSNNGWMNLAQSFIISFAVLVAIALVIWVIQIRIINLIPDKKRVRQGIILLCSLLSAYASHQVGLSAVVGGFIAGFIFGLFKAKNDQFAIEFNRVSEYVIPIFFMSIGLQITQIYIQDFGSLIFISTIVAVAIAGKYFSSRILFTSLNNFEIKLLGISMVPRAEVTLIIATTGMSQGHLSDLAMLSLIFVVLITSLTSSYMVPKLSKIQQ